MKIIDTLLNKITMYRLVLYYLILLLVVAGIYSQIGILSYSITSIFISTIILIGVCWITNYIFSKVFKAPTNVESVYISALILALILTPIRTFQDLPLLLWAGTLAMASKYILAINKKHIFNPVAIAVVLTAIGFNGTASWWIGTMSMLPFELAGILIVMKIRRFDLVYYFFLSAFITILILNISNGSSIPTILHDTVFASSIFFFAFVMLTEPLTTPPTKTLQSIYGALVGILFVPQFHIGTFYTTPEISLAMGNIFSYLVSPKVKIITIVKEKIQTAQNSMDFLFSPQAKLAYKPGQYMEWTLPHKSSDSRGNRRYFTIASSPTEQLMRLGVKFSPNGSSFKKAMQQIDTKTPLVGAQLAGDFTLHSNKNMKLVFIAGGIGITPFRSMLKYLVDKGEQRSIILFYANKNIDEIVYTDVLNEAQEKLGINVVYTLTDVSNIPINWQGYKGRINEQMITNHVPDYRERTFYLSGPNSMIESFEKILLKMGVSRKRIKKDYFAGLA